ncbi:hypothetical protein MUP05_11075 [Candidatus Bathyarchaeota archaeon]|nr:hypothetical protein [Candidatus Bathyarchaeota archaeon]
MPARVFWSKRKEKTQVCGGGFLRIDARHLYAILSPDLSPERLLGPSEKAMSIFSSVDGLVVIPKVKMFDIALIIFLRNLV